MYEAGPRAEPWMTLASIVAIADTSHIYALSEQGDQVGASSRRQRTASDVEQQQQVRPYVDSQYGPILCDAGLR